jgi:hypothetical protein
MTVGGLVDTVFRFNRLCECHLYTAPRNKSLSKNSGSFENNIGTSKLHQPEVGIQVFLEAHQNFPKTIQP